VAQAADVIVHAQDAYARVFGTPWPSHSAHRRPCCLRLVLSSR